MEDRLFDLHADIEQSNWWFVGRRRILSAVIEAVMTGRDRDLLLDVGCGTGANLAGFSGWKRRVGVDSSEDAIRLARERFPGVEFVEGRVPEDVVADLGSADLVTMNDVLEHIERDQDFFDSVWTGMREGAQVLITVPADPKMWSSHDEAFGHFRRYTEPTVARLWADKGARVRLLSAFNSRLYWVARVARSVQLGDRVNSDKTDFVSLPGPFNSIVAQLFAGESTRLLRTIDRGSGDSGAAGNGGYRRGVSLIAVLEKA